MSKAALSACWTGDGTQVSEQPEHLFAPTETGKVTGVIDPNSQLVLHTCCQVQHGHSPSSDPASNLISALPGAASTGRDSRSGDSLPDWLQGHAHWSLLCHLVVLH